MLQAGCLFFTLKSTDSIGILNDKLLKIIKLTLTVKLNPIFSFQGV